MLKIVFFLFVIAYIAVVFFFFDVAMNSKSKFRLSMMMTSEQYRKVLEQKKIAEPYIKERFNITSDDGLQLYADYMPCENPERTVILVHGWRSSWFIDFAYVSVFLHRINCDIIMICQRAQGISEGKYMTFGRKEYRDVLKWADFTKSDERFADRPLYIFGNSMGAATVLLCAEDAVKHGIKGIIADAGFTSVYDEFGYVRDYAFHIPEWLLMPTFRLMCKIRLGIDVKNVCPCETIKKASVPGLLFHGDADNFVPEWMGKKNYENYYGDKKYVLTRNAGHCASHNKDTDTYEKEVSEFFSQCEK